MDGLNSEETSIEITQSEQQRENSLENKPKNPIKQLQGPVGL